jgi:hypothetical protein
MCSHWMSLIWRSLHVTVWKLLQHMPQLLNICFVCVAVVCQCCMLLRECSISPENLTKPLFTNWWCYKFRSQQFPMLFRFSLLLQVNLFVIRLFCFLNLNNKYMWELAPPLWLMSDDGRWKGQLGANLNPPCKHSLREETRIPGENPRLSVDHHLTLHTSVMSPRSQR